MSTSLIKLQNHLNSFSIKELRLQWDMIKELNFKSPNAFEYLDFLDDSYCTPYSREMCPQELISPENMTPNFSGSLFLCNIVL